MNALAPALLPLLALAASAQTADDARRALRQRGDLDEIRWKDPAQGPAFRAGVVRATATGLEVQRTLPSGVLKRELPYAQIGGVKFGLTQGERQLIADARPEHVEVLRVFWEARSRTLTLSGSNAGDFGLALARALRGIGTPAALAEAQRLAAEIAGQDHDPQRRSQARQESQTLAFLHLLRTGKPAEVEKRAWAVTEAAEDSPPDLMLLATACLREREFAALQRLETEHPRWVEDAEIEPQRQRHYHLALDLALYPSLFHPLRAPEAAAGLWHAAQVHLHCREIPQAAAALDDLLALYPDTPAAAQARALRPALQTGDPAQAATPQTAASKAAEPAPATEPMGPPPPPKRYNLFED